MPVLRVRLRLKAITAHVEPHRRIKRRFLLHQDVHQLVVERIAVFAGGEIALLPAPVADGLSHALNQLANAGLALWRARLITNQRPMQIFAGHNIDGGHRPVFGRLNITLLKNAVALGVSNAGRAQLPLHFVIGRNAGPREIARKFQPGRRLSRLS